MPKVEKDVHVSSKRKSLFIYIYNGKRVMGVRRETHQAAVLACRDLFPGIPKDYAISFVTSDLEECDGQLTEVSPEIWEEVIHQLKSITVTSEESNSNGRSTSPVPPKVYTSVERKSVTLVCGGSSVDFRVKGTTRMSKILEAAAREFDKCASDLAMIFDGAYVHPTATVLEMGIEDGDQIDCRLRQVGGKPVIYIFSPDVIEASVELSLSPQWELSAVYPVAPNTQAKSKACWRVQAHPNGDLTELDIGVDISYLFWEAHTLPKAFNTPPPSPVSQVIPSNLCETFIPNDAVISDDNAVLLSTDVVTPYLDSALKALGLHTEARTSFITYWLSSLLKHKQVALRFLPQAAYENAAPLKIVPSPDVTTRIFMLFQGISDIDLATWSSAKVKASEDGHSWTKIVGVDVAKTLNSQLFRVIEWGGMEVLA